MTNGTTANNRLSGWQVIVTGTATEEQRRRAARRLADYARRKATEEAGQATASQAHPTLYKS